MSNQVCFMVNGKPVISELDWDKKLLDILREELNLTGTKRGCDTAACGSCTVIVDGRAVKSCVLPATKLEGAEVITIEGLSVDSVHPIQQELVDAGAVQCGFCTPGIVMELYALFAEKPEANDDEIVKVLNRHLCRCTGYETILEGAIAARRSFKKLSFS